MNEKTTKGDKKMTNGTKKMTNGTDINVVFYQMENLGIDVFDIRYKLSTGRLNINQEWALIESILPKKWNNAISEINEKINNYLQISDAIASQSDENKERNGWNNPDAIEIAKNLTRMLV